MSGFLRDHILSWRNTKALEASWNWIGEVNKNNLYVKCNWEDFGSNSINVSIILYNTRTFKLK